MIGIEQGTDAWRQARLGKVTASRVADVLARIKTGWGASRANYMAELIAERLTGTAAEGFTNAAMAWGTEKEPDARAAYEFHTDASVELVGFIIHPTIAMSGASPDGFVGADGMVEIKCPNTATHIDFLQVQTIPDKYVKQMTWQMACTGRLWCDFVSYDPRMPEVMRLWVKRVYLDAVALAAMEKDIREFLSEVDAKVADLSARFKFQSEAA